MQSRRRTSKAQNCCNDGAKISRYTRASVEDTSGGALPMLGYVLCRFEEKVDYIVYIYPVAHDIRTGKR
jgi:hypothetical protein